MKSSAQTKREALHRRQDELLSRLPDSAAENELVKSLDGAIYSIAYRYATAARLGRDGLGDLIAEGRIGALVAIRRFDRSRGLRLLTYATWWIRHEIARSLDESGHLIRLPVNAREKRRRVARARVALEHTLGRAPTDEELSGATGVSVRALARVAGPALDDPVSFDAPATNEFEGMVLLDRLASDDPTAEDRMLANEEERLVREAVRGLSSRERDILLGRVEGKTLEQLGVEVGSVQKARAGVGRERVRQIEAIALGKLRRRYLARIEGR